MADPVEQLLAGARRIAVVGASDDSSRPSNGVMRTLLDAGYEVVPVNPKLEDVHGVPAVSSLEEIEGDIDIVDVFRRPEHAPAIAREAVAAGVATLWLQSGITSRRAREIALEGGVGFVENLCLATVVRRTAMAG